MADSVSSTDAKLLKELGGVGLVMTIIFTISFVLVIVILVKRQILRMLLLSKRGPHSPVGFDTPKSLGREIAARLQRISQLRMEPRMLSEQFNKPFDGTANFESPSDQYTRSYKYRMKAMDKMTELDDLLCTIDFKYSRKKKQSVREHLKSLQKAPYNVIRGGDDTVNEVSDMYEHARFETKEFGALQYRKFAYLVEQLKDRVKDELPLPTLDTVVAPCVPHSYKKGSPTLV
ncbi:protein C1orf43 homolog isoform X2 [Montipora foliosa]|uniref:protein C1orf43 homolog isoform X2 n=1 Tax=Montipora foliosa TaxID=591990 RepID=UPI0035F11B60